MTLLNTVKLSSFGITLVAAIVVLAIGMMLKNPNATRNIAGTSLNTTFNISLCVWGFFALILLAICVYHAFSRPDLALLHLVCVLLVLGFCATYVQLDPEMLQVWGPLAVDLGITLSAGIRAAWRSADGTTFRSFVDSLLPRRSNNNNDDFDTIPLDTLPQHSRARLGTYNV